MILTIEKNKRPAIMKVTSANYSQANKRVIFLHDLYIDGRISTEEGWEMFDLLAAIQQYVDESDAEALAEHEFMTKFEDSFVNSFDR